MATPVVKEGLGHGNPAGQAGPEESWSEAWQRWNRRKGVDMYARESKSSGLSKTLTARDLTVLGVSAIIGAGIFALPGLGVAVAGPAVVFGFIIAAIAAGFAALNYAELATMMPISGSAYAYSYASVGEMLAWLVGWNLVLEYALGNVAVAVAWGDFLFSALEPFGFPAAFAGAPGTQVRLADGTFVTGIFHAPAFAIVLLIMTVLIRGVKESAKTATVIVGIKLFVLLFVIFFGAFYINPANYNPFAPFGIFGIMGSAALVFFAYIGFDAVSTAAEETKNPGRDLPIGIIGSLVICTVLYIAVTMVLTGITPWQNIAGSGDAAAQAFSAAGLTTASAIIAVGAIVGITGVLLVFQLGMPRIFMTMARDGLLPKKLAEVDPETHVPKFTTVYGSILIAFAAGLTPLAAAAELVNIGTLFAFLVVSFAVILLRKTMPDAPRPFKVPFAPWVPLIGVVFIVGLMLALQPITLLRFVAWSGLGILIYGFYGARRSQLRRGGGAAAAAVPGEGGPGGATPAKPKAKPRKKAA
jgi:basic amino acid/polyamine antiporter, APA family